jgi:hypothetical protein
MADESDTGRLFRENDEALARRSDLETRRRQLVNEAAASIFPEFAEDVAAKLGKICGGRATSSKIDAKHRDPLAVKYEFHCTGSHGETVKFWVTIVPEWLSGNDLEYGLETSGSVNYEGASEVIAAIPAGRSMRPSLAREVISQAVTSALQKILDRKRF